MFERTNGILKYQGVLLSDVDDKVELYDLLGVHYPGPDELRRLEEEAEREATH